MLFLDEPTTGLDPRSRQAMWELVSELARAGATVLLTTQYLEEADRLADRIAVIDGGRVVAEGTADELKRRVAGHRLELIATDADAYDATRRQRAGELTVDADPAALTPRVACDGGAGAVRARLDELDPDRDADRPVRARTAPASTTCSSTLTGKPTPPTEGEPSDD